MTALGQDQQQRPADYSRVETPPDPVWEPDMNSPS